MASTQTIIDSLNRLLKDEKITQKQYDEAIKYSTLALNMEPNNERLKQNHEIYLKKGN